MNPAIKKYLHKKRFAKFLIVGFLFAMCLTGYGIKSLATESSDEITKAGKVEQIRPDIQFMPRLDVALPNGVEKLAVWPSQEEIRKSYAKTDISEKFPPVFLEGERLKGRPVKEGAVSPNVANKQAARWIRQVMKPEWVPKEIETFMIPLRDERPQNSRVICRYKIGDASIQISQTRWAMSVLLNLRDKENPDDAERFVAAVFKKYFNEGDKMAALKGNMAAKESVRDSGDINVSLMDMTKLRAPEAVQSWWGWLAWANKNRTVVVFLPKRILGEQHTIDPDEPWF